MLINYEDLVTQPVNEFKKIFQFYGIPYNHRYASIIHSKSKYKQINFEIDSDVIEMCNDMMSRLNKVYENTKKI